MLAEKFPLFGKFFGYLMVISTVIGSIIGIVNNLDRLISTFQKKPAGKSDT